MVKSRGTDPVPPPARITQKSARQSYQWTAPELGSDLLRTAHRVQESVTRTKGAFRQPAREIVPPVITKILLTCQFVIAQMSMRAWLAPGFAERGYRAAPHGVRGGDMRETGTADLRAA